MHDVSQVQKTLTSVQQRSQTLLSMLLITATVTTCFPVLTPSAVAQQPTQSLVQTRRVNRASILDAILKLFKQPKHHLGSRGTPQGNLCVIAPGQLEEVNVIWSDRPFFLWQGTVQRLEVRPYSLETLYSNQPMLWSQTLTATTAQNTVYTGQPLQPGQKYDWQLVVDSSSQDNPRFTFQVMEKEKRDLMSAELTALETQLKAAGASPEAIALQRANYFAERDLWSDVLQEIYSVKNPSTALTSTAQEIAAYSCRG